MEYSLQLLYNNLKTNELIGNNFVTRLREYIKAKYPGSDSTETAQIFADAINKAIDKHISHFDENQRQDIRKSLLQNSMSKGKFAITAADIFEISLTSGIKTDDFLNFVTEWVNEVQNIPISSDMLHEIIESIEESKGEKISFEELLSNVHEDAAREVHIPNEPKVVDSHQRVIHSIAVPFVSKHKLLVGIMLLIICLQV